jgi:hypothetical protein
MKKLQRKGIYCNEINIMVPAMMLINATTYTADISVGHYL